MCIPYMYIRTKRKPLTKAGSLHVHSLHQDEEKATHQGMESTCVFPTSGRRESRSPRHGVYMCIPYIRTKRKPLTKAWSLHVYSLHQDEEKATHQGRESTCVFPTSGRRESRSPRHGVYMCIPYIRTKRKPLTKAGSLHVYYTCKRGGQM